MTGQFLFVSCDIIRHSEQPEDVQLERVIAVNAVVKRFLDSRPAAYWFSAGDGGHVALPADDIAGALDLLLGLKQWSVGAKVPLRISAAAGSSAWFSGADGRRDLIGDGINRAAFILRNAGGDTRIVASDAFRTRAQNGGGHSWTFHDPIEFTALPGSVERVWLMSSAGFLASQWDSADAERADAWPDDRITLRRAVAAGQGLLAMYHAKRLLQTNGADSDALSALRNYLGPAGTRIGTSRMLAQLLADTATGLEFIRASALVERAAGEVLCRTGDEGTTMFLLLRGRLQGFLGRSEGSPGLKPDFEVGPGELLGEMAFALRAKRAATLVCAGSCSLLAFGQQELRATSDPDLRARIQEAVDALVLVRVLQNTCRAATYLSGPDRSGPLGAIDRPWQELLPHSRLISLHWREHEIDFASPTFAETGIYILVGGAVATRQEIVIQATAPQPPILKAAIGGRMFLPHERYRILDEVKILFVRVAGLEQFGPRVYAQLAARATERAPLPQAVSSGPVVEGLLRVGGAEGASRRLDVIFVHGLGGDARNTWHPDDDPEAFWPSWLASDIPGIAVWSLGYDVSPSAWKGTSMPLVDRAVNSLAKLEAQGLGDRPIIFVCHSMGGLLVKQMLRHGADYGVESWKGLAAKTRGLVFLSTPHSGSDLANWMKHLGFLLRATVSVDELRAQDPRLRDLNTWFRNWMTKQIAVHAYCEKLPMNGLIVVDEGSADPGVQGVVVIPVDENHATICKPASRDKLVYQRVKKFVADYASAEGR